MATPEQSTQANPTASTEVGVAIEADVPDEVGSPTEADVSQGEVSQGEDAPRLASGVPVEPNDSIQEYQQLRRELLLITLALTAIAVGSVWLAYGLNIALNYLIGACTGLIYLNMLAKHVGQLGRQRSQMGNSRLALLVGVILVASRINQLEILPIFLGFLTYKAALIIYVFRSVLVPPQAT